VKSGSLSKISAAVRSGLGLIGRLDVLARPAVAPSSCASSYLTIRSKARPAVRTALDRHDFVLEREDA